VYLQRGSTVGVPARPAEVAALMQKRNEVAAWLQRGALPPMLQQEHACARCFQASACSLFHRAAGGDAASARMGEGVFERLVGHLTREHLEYFACWERGIALEEAESARRQQEAWAQSGTRREKAGACFARMRLAAHRPSQAQAQVLGQGLGQGQGGASAGAGAHEYEFERAESDGAFERRFGARRRPLPDVGLGEGDAVTVRSDGGGFSPPPPPSY